MIRVTPTPFVDGGFQTSSAILYVDQDLGLLAPLLGHEQYGNMPATTEVLIVERDPKGACICCAEFN
jgi:hypothetical protein